jgi:hypothetical protein
MFCREWLAQVERHHTEIQATGLKVVAVGIGEPKHAPAFNAELVKFLKGK